MLMVSLRDYQQNRTPKDGTLQARCEPVGAALVEMDVDAVVTGAPKRKPV